MTAAHLQPWIAIGTRLVDAARRVSGAAVGLWQTVNTSRRIVDTRPVREERRAVVPYIGIMYHDAAHAAASCTLLFEGIVSLRWLMVDLENCASLESVSFL